jgi:hypothetical protein
LSRRDVIFVENVSARLILLSRQPELMVAERQDIGRKTGILFMKKLIILFCGLLVLGCVIISLKYFNNKNATALECYDSVEEILKMNRLDSDYEVEIYPPKEVAPYAMLDIQYFPPGTEKIEGKISHDHYGFTFRHNNPNPDLETAMMFIKTGNGDIGYALLHKRHPENPRSNVETEDDSNAQIVRVQDAQLN